METTQTHLFAKIFFLETVRRAPGAMATTTLYLFSGSTTALENGLPLMMETTKSLRNSSAMLM